MLFLRPGYYLEECSQIILDTIAHFVVILLQTVRTRKHFLSFLRLLSSFVKPLLQHLRLEMIYGRQIYILCYFLSLTYLLQKNGTIKCVVSFRNGQPIPVMHRNEESQNVYTSIGCSIETVKHQAFLRKGWIVKRKLWRALWFSSFAEVTGRIVLEYYHNFNQRRKT